MGAIDKKAFFEVIGYEPHVKQWLYHNAEERFRVPVCGRRFGKSTMAARDMEPELMDPRDRKIFWIIGPTYDLGEKEFRVIWDDLIIRQGFGNHKKVQKRFNKKQGDMFIELPWGTRVEVRSAQHPENLVGEALDGAIMSEAAKQREGTWERFIRPVLADKRGWATFPTTPEGQNWLHKVWQIGQNPEFPDWASWQFATWDNLAMFPGGRNDPEILLIEKTTDPLRFAQEYAADFTAFVGKVFQEWRETTHVQKVEYDPSLPNYMCFDWGYVNPLACIEFQVTPRDEVRVWREHYLQGETLDTHLQIMANRHQPEGYGINLAFGDAADPEAVEYVSRNLVGCVADPAAKENWRDGVELIKSFMRLREVGKADEYGTPLERPGLIVDHSCVNLIREMNNYKMKQGANSLRNPSSPRELPQTIDDHAIDALRYGLVHLYRLGANTHLADVIDITKLREANEQAGFAGDSGYFVANTRF